MPKRRKLTHWQKKRYADAIKALRSVLRIVPKSTPDGNWSEARDGIENAIAELKESRALLVKGY